MIETFYDYPNFRMYLRCNLNNDQGDYIGFYGTKGTLGIQGSTLTYTPQDTRPQPEGYSIYGWPAKLRNEYLAQFAAENPLSSINITEPPEVFTPPAAFVSNKSRIP